MVPAADGGGQMEPEVSIIVPVYNAEKYLERCIESILGQEFREFELLLIDDGSTDGSGQICDRAAGKDPRVVVIHKENSGVSDARNTGISRARGTYLQFVDSDDWLTRDATKLMVRMAEANGCDMVITDFYRVVGERVSHKGDIEEDGVLSREEFAAFMMENPADFYYGVLWNKLYRRDLVKTHGLRMDSALSWCEDFMFNLEYIRYAETFCALRTPVYYYVKTRGSLVSQGMNISRIVKMKLLMFECYNSFYKHVLDEDEYEKRRLQVYRFLVAAAGDGFVLPAALPGARKLGEERIRVIPEAITENGVLMDSYRNRKLLERCLEPAALKHEISIAEACLILILKGSGRTLSRKRLAELLQISRTSLAVAIQKLTARKLVGTEEMAREKGAERKLKLWLLPASRGILDDLEEAENEFRQVCLSGLDEEEILDYDRLTGKVKENIRKALE